MKVWIWIGSVNICWIHIEIWYLKKNVYLLLIKNWSLPDKSYTRKKKLFTNGETLQILNVRIEPINNLFYVIEMQRAIVNILLKILIKNSIEYKN